jgi:hypothetical protein
VSRTAGKILRCVVPCPDTTMNVLTPIAQGFLASRLPVPARFLFSCDLQRSGVRRSHVGPPISLSLLSRSKSKSHSPFRVADIASLKPLLCQSQHHRFHPPLPTDKGTSTPSKSYRTVPFRRKILLLHIYPAHACW